MSPRTTENVAADLVRLAVAGSPDPAVRAEVEARVRKLTAEACGITAAATAAEARRSLARAWGAWLELAMSTGVLRDVLDLEPALRRRFLLFLEGKKDG